MAKLDKLFVLYYYIFRKEGEKGMGYLERKRKYVLQYQKENYVGLVLHFNRKYDGELIEALNKMPNKSEYVRNLIKKDLGIQ